MTRLAKLRTRAFFAQQCRCIYCHLPIWEGPYKDRLVSALGIPESLVPYLQSTAEHLVAQQQGGLDVPVNIAAACWWCNWKRHAHRHDCAPDPVTFQAEVHRLMAAKRWHPAARWLSRALPGCEGRSVRA
jgi:hypothetical protein